jgi:hypothetical protein
MGIVLFFLLPMLATIPVAGMICRIRVAHQKRVSYGTMFASACCVPLVLALAVSCISPDIWSREGKNVPELWLVMLAFLVAMCVLPALFVVLYYQRRSKKDETRVA